MPLFIDSYFTKGVSHKVCEDYTMHGDIDGNQYAIVCDGCSGSDDTDFGARLLARSAREAYKTLIRGNYFSHITEHYDRVRVLEEEIKLNLSSMVKSTYSNLNVADATLMMAFNIADKMYVFVRGDGTYAYRERDTGDLIITEIEFHSGAPYYFTYDLHAVHNRLYAKLANQAKVVTTHRYNSNGELKDTKVETLKYDEVTYKTLDAWNIDFVSVMSDGVSAFQYSGKYMGEKTPDATNVFNIVQNVVAYKNHNGEFVQRRMNRAMRDFEKQGLENFDDVSVATIWLGGTYHEEGKGNS